MKREVIKKFILGSSVLFELGGLVMLFCASWQATLFYLISTTIGIVLCRLFFDMSIAAENQDETRKTEKLSKLITFFNAKLKEWGYTETVMFVPEQSSTQCEEQKDSTVTPGCSDIVIEPICISCAEMPIVEITETPKVKLVKTKKKVTKKPKTQIKQ